MIEETFGPAPAADEKDSWEATMNAVMEVVLNKNGNAAIEATISQLLQMGPCKYKCLCVSSIPQL